MNIPAAWCGMSLKRNMQVMWSWSLGPYVDAIIKVHGTEGIEQAQEVINRFAYHLNEACVGSVSEIFDAEPPHHPRGCIAQAWGVAEVLRVIKDNSLYNIKVEKAKLEMEAAEV